MSNKVLFKNLRLGGMAAVLLATVACQTTSSVPPLDTPDAKLAKELISSSCAFGRGKNGFSVGGMATKAGDQFIIRSITKGKEEWWRVGYIWSGSYWYYFINLKKDLIYCGEDTFRKQGGHLFRKVEGTIADNAMTRALGKTGKFSSSQGPKPEKYAKVTDKTICHRALHANLVKWKEGKYSISYKNEAIKRNLTLQKCAAILGR